MRLLDQRLHPAVNPASVPKRPPCRLPEGLRRARFSRSIAGRAWFQRGRTRDGCDADAPGYRLKLLTCADVLVSLEQALRISAGRSVRVHGEFLRFSTKLCQNLWRK